MAAILSRSQCVKHQPSQCRPQITRSFSTFWGFSWFQMYFRWWGIFQNGRRNHAKFRTVECQVSSWSAVDSLVTLPLSDYAPSCTSNHRSLSLRRFQFLCCFWHANGLASNPQGPGEVVSVRDLGWGHFFPFYRRIQTAVFSHHDVCQQSTNLLLLLCFCFLLMKNKTKYHDTTTHHMKYGKFRNTCILFITCIRVLPWSLRLLASQI